jgi:hypothetical protein
MTGHRRLLGARSERPSGCAAEERDEVAPIRLIELHFDVPSARKSPA